MKNKALEDLAFKNFDLFLPVSIIAYVLLQDNEDRYAAVTQFEAADARRCFPCWDEPAIKATFTLKVTAPKNRTVHSNMPTVSLTI